MTLTVTDCSRSSSDPGSLPTAVADSTPGDTITFATGLSCPPSSPILLTSAITVDTSVTITGPGANTMAVSGGGTVGVLEVSSGTVAESGLTIENGIGGIFNSGGGVTISSDSPGCHR